MSEAPLPAWSGYVILAVLGALSVAIVALVRSLRRRAGEISWLRRHGPRRP